MRQPGSSITVTALCVLGLVGCGPRLEEAATRLPQAAAPTIDAGIANDDRAGNAAAVAAEAAARAADDQSQSPDDLALARRIQQSIASDEALSSVSRSVRVVTRGGTVTLHGPVRDEKERTAIGGKALRIAGTGKVENLLEIAPSGEPDLRTSSRQPSRGYGPARGWRASPRPSSS